MDPQYLGREELEYELQVRGYTEFGPESVRSLRRMLSRKLEKEAFGTLECHASFTPDVNQEILACNQVVTLETFIDQFDGDHNSAAANYMFTVLQRLNGRLRRLSFDASLDEADASVTSS